MSAIIEPTLILGSMDEVIVMLVAQWRLKQSLTQNNAFLTTFSLLKALELYAQQKDIYRFADSLALERDLVDYYCAQRGIS